MKVTHARSRLLSTPADNPLVVGLDQAGTREFVTLELTTDDGVEGIGITFFGAALTPALKSAVDSFAELVIGEDIDLMCDINQLWNVNQAIEVGTRIADYHLFWLEDVVACDDYAGLARVADALTTPIATGEYVYGIVPHRHLIENRSVDIVMIDLWRVGGVTQWLKVAAMAE